MLVDYHVHAMGHGKGSHTMDNLEPFVRQAIKKGIKEIGFCEHDWVCSNPDFSIFENLQRKYPQIAIKVGLEVDHIIGREEEIPALIKGQPFDYVLGGIHHLGETRWMFDHPGYIDGYRGKNIDELYRQYFATVEDAANSGFYQIMAHLDVIKVFGYRPEKPVLSLMGTLLQTIKEKSLTVEINTNGLYKPVGEIYPAVEVLEECFRYQIPITFSSDAHRAEDVGRDTEIAAGLAKKIGYTQIASFEKGKRVMKDICFC